LEQSFTVGMPLITETGALELLKRC